MNNYLNTYYRVIPVLLVIFLIIYILLNRTNGLTYFVYSKRLTIQLFIASLSTIESSISVIIGIFLGKKIIGIVLLIIYTIVTIFLIFDKLHSRRLIEQLISEEEKDSKQSSSM